MLVYCCLGFVWKRYLYKNETRFPFVEPVVGTFISACLSACLPLHNVYQSFSIVLSFYFIFFFVLQNGTVYFFRSRHKNQQNGNQADKVFYTLLKILLKWFSKTSEIFLANLPAQMVVIKTLS